VGHYEVVGRRIKTTGGYNVQREFEPDDPLIQKIYDLLCDPEMVLVKYPELAEYVPKEIREAQK